MEQATIPDLVSQRDNLELEKQADEYLKDHDWKRFLSTFQYTAPRGKARDALVALLELEAVGGTDSDIFKEFSSLEGTSLHEVRFQGVQRAMEILREQIAERHTYFLDVEVMAETPYAILVKDVIDARKRELAELEHNPSRIDILGTFYGFAILMAEGTKPHDNQATTGYGYRRWRRRTWLDENITDSAANAIKTITSQFAEEVDMDKTYRTLGSSPIFKGRCTKETANILADAVRLSMYKVPGNRAAAARKLGATGDSRVLPFLHHRLPREQSYRVRIKIAEAMGNVGHISSIDYLKEQVRPEQRNISKDTKANIEAIGGIYCPESKQALLEIVQKGGNTVKAVAIESLGKQDSQGLLEIISPYLEHKSRPVVRSSVLALSNLGKNGRKTLIAKAPAILAKIGNDKPSMGAVSKLLEIPKVGKMRLVQEYYVQLINKQRREVERWKRYEQQRTGYNYWYQRRARRVTDRMRLLVNLVFQNLKPPYHVELMGTMKAAVSLCTNINDILLRFGDNEFGRAFREYLHLEERKITYEQLRFT